MDRYSTVGKTGMVDDYINPGASSELPPPKELIDKDEHIRLLQEDLSRSACREGQLMAQNTVLKKENKRLKMLLGEKAKEGDKPTVQELREMSGWSRKELQKRSGLTYDCIYKRERKQYVWRDEQKKAVAKALGVDVESVDWDG